MNIRWRLGVLVIQATALLLITYLVTNKPFSDTIWYASLIAIILNTSLLEPFFPKPSDTLANSIVGIIFYFISIKQITHIAWKVLLILFFISLALAAVSILIGKKAEQGIGGSISQATRRICRIANARSIYSLTFIVSLVDFTRGIDDKFWVLAFAWLMIMILSSVNWQAVIFSATGRSSGCIIEGIKGPSRIQVSSDELPWPGTRVKIKANRINTDGVVTSRIMRKDNCWSEIHINDNAECEKICKLSSITLEKNNENGGRMIGVVDAGSTHLFLIFIPTQELRIGDVVCVPYGSTHIAYQIISAEIQDSKVQGGVSQVVRARANQLGIFDPQTLTLKRHPWVPQPGAPVVGAPEISYDLPPDDGSKILLGYVIGTEIPIFIDCDSLCQGHLAILGMTRMGKTTLALRLARGFSRTRSVVVLDQTGEYSSKQDLPAYVEETHISTAGLSVFEPPPGKDVVIADEGLKHFKKMIRKGFAEYRDSVPLPRVMMVDEAHQFVPEPSMLGFNSAGRESAIKFGMLMMQVRKYGIAVTLISQRTAVVAKSALSQCENLIAFKSVDQTGLEYLDSILGAGARSILPVLNQGEALVFGPGISSETAVAIHTLPATQPA